MNITDSDSIMASVFHKHTIYMYLNAFVLTENYYFLQKLAAFGSLKKPVKLTLLRAMSSPATYQFETLKVTRPKDFVVHVELNRPEKRNAMNQAFWRWVVQYTCNKHSQ